MQTLETLSKEDWLYVWCKEKKLFSYVDVQEYKNNHFYLRADRTIRDFVNEGKLRRIPDGESRERGLVLKGRAALAWFECL